MQSVLGKRIPCCLAVAAIIAAPAFVWLYFIEPRQAWCRWNQRTEAAIWRLASKCPANVAPGSWEFLVGWTINLSTNCGFQFKGKVPRRELDDFAEELERRSQAPDVTTIDWIWDNYVRLTDVGPSYDRFRPTRPGSGWEKAQVGCFGLAALAK